MLEKQTPLVVPPRASAPPQAKSSPIALTSQQISQIAQIFDPAVEDELAMARMAWMEYRATRERDTVYQYLTVVFQIVTRWKKERRAKASLRQALIATKQPGATRIDEPFAAFIFCTSDRTKLDAKTRSKWARALQFAERSKPNIQGLTQFIKGERAGERSNISEISVQLVPLVGKIGAPSNISQCHACRNNVLSG
jgi:hypothetical protein